MFIFYLMLYDNNIVTKTPAKIRDDRNIPQIRGNLNLGWI